MKRVVATVEKVEYTGDDVITIHFSLPAAHRFHYEAGQYITVFFEHSSTPAGKAYSLSSAPHETLYSITVKNVGEFSGRLYDMTRGDTFELSEPYGHFNPRTLHPIVALSAGVGIAPVWSVLKDELHHGSERALHLFYTNRSPETIAHHETIAVHAEAHPSFLVHHHLTRTANVPALMHAGRIDLDACVQAVEGEVRYLICGSVAFVRDMWRGLTERGVSGEYISTETFFE